MEPGKKRGISKKGETCFRDYRAGKNSALLWASASLAMCPARRSLSTSSTLDIDLGTDRGVGTMSRKQVSPFFEMPRFLPGSIDGTRVASEPQAVVGVVCPDELAADNAERADGSPLGL